MITKLFCVNVHGLFIAMERCCVKVHGLFENKQDELISNSTGYDTTK